MGSSLIVFSRVIASALITLIPPALMSFLFVQMVSANSLSLLCVSDSACVFLWIVAPIIYVSIVVGLFTADPLILFEKP